jgi:hypothetical protein
MDRAEHQGSDFLWMDRIRHIGWFRELGDRQLGDFAAGGVMDALHDGKKLSGF